MTIWTPIENAKVIGILPDYRSLIAKNITRSKAQEICAKQLINNDTLNIFTNRINRVNDPVRTIGQHIEVMDQIASGATTPKRGDEYSWHNCFKY